jgi:predicted MPP superfamily phosphohydrolase
MRPLLILLFVTLFMVGVDLYTLRGIQHLVTPGPAGHRWIQAVFWGVSAVMFTVLLWAGGQFQQMRDPSRFFGVMVVMGIFLMVYLPKILFNVFQLGGDLTGLVVRLLGGHSDRIRHGFLWPGAVAALLLMTAFGMGMIRGRTHVKVFREEIPLARLPKAFEGMRIVQISDLHLAGFYNQPGYVRKVVEQVNSLEPDLLLFTGDMVHNFSEEVDPFLEELLRLKAPMGKFAILGNHDYGHYFRWKSAGEEEANLERVKSQIRAAGFDLLLNEFRSLQIDGQSVELLGVENWGKPPFPQHGDLEAALKGTDPQRVKILMSHDPSHWDLQVKGKVPVGLTLAGHTHGMQFGIELGNFRWSPSRWAYRYWAGLYRENGQYLYVNRGLGFTGFPGRVGIRPEITLITLTRD